MGGGCLIFSIPQCSSHQCNKPLILCCDFSTAEFFLCHFKYFCYDFNHTQIHHISFCFNTTCRAYGNVHCSLIHNFISWSLKSIVCTHFQIQFHDSFLKFPMSTNICIMISVTHQGIDSFVWIQQIFTFGIFFPIQQLEFLKFFNISFLN